LQYTQGPTANCAVQTDHSISALPGQRRRAERLVGVVRAASLEIFYHVADCHLWFNRDRQMDMRRSASNAVQNTPPAFWQRSVSSLCTTCSTAGTRIGESSLVCQLKCR
jgi:hypothetical protein